MVDRSKKYVRLGLVREEPTVPADSYSKDDSVHITGMTVNKSSEPVFQPSSVDITMENQLSQQITEVVLVTADDVVKETKEVTFSSTETKTVTLNFTFEEFGDVEVKSAIANDTNSKTVNVEF